MTNKTILLSALLLIAMPDFTYSAILQEDNTNQQANVCDALATLKCTLYKLEAIANNHQSEDNQAGELGNISQTSAAMDIIKCTIHKLQNILDYSDSCPSLDFDNSCSIEDICPSLNFDDSCSNNDYDECDDNYESCNLANLPINININCNHTEKVNIYLKIQACKKLKQETNS